MTKQTRPSEQQQWLNRGKDWPSMLSTVARLACGDNVAQGVIPPFRERRHVILGQFPLASLITVAAAMIIRDLHSNPLGSGEIINSNSGFSRTTFTAICAYGFWIYRAVLTLIDFCRLWIGRIVSTTFGIKPFRVRCMMFTFLGLYSLMVIRNIFASFYPNGLRIGSVTLSASSVYLLSIVRNVFMSSCQCTWAAFVVQPVFCPHMRVEIFSCSWQPLLAFRALFQRYLRQIWDMIGSNHGVHSYKMNGMASAACVLRTPCGMSFIPTSIAHFPSKDASKARRA